YVVPRHHEQFALADVRASLREHLPHYMIPASVQVLEQFPLTANGKVDRARLAEVAPEALAPRAIAEPRSLAEKVLAGIWRRVLQTDSVGIDDNFFDLGGASIQTLEVVTLASQDVLKLSPDLLFRHQTIVEL